VQCWQILVGKAMNRQTVTYEGLSELMYRRHAAGVLSKILGHVAFYCIEQKLPALTAIVVGKGGGVPGDDIPLAPAQVDSEREAVYRFDWFDVYPPSADELAAAFANHA
jgi:hypothetical protein